MNRLLSDGKMPLLCVNKADTKSANAPDHKAVKLSLKGALSRDFYVLG